MVKVQNGLQFTSLKVEGGLLPPEFFNKVAHWEAPHQNNTDYGLTRSLNLRDELGRYWRIAQDLWEDYKKRRDQALLESDKYSLGVDYWLLGMLEQVLGYHSISSQETLIINERQFPELHFYHDGTIPMVLTINDYLLDTSYPKFGDEGRRRPPHALVQEYLNANKASLWGLVSNGHKIRLLRDNPSLTRPAFIEADLEQMFEEGLYSDFATFWLLFHASRVIPREGKPEQCILELWRKEALDTGERVREKLRNGVTEALKQFGSGFLQHPANEELRQALHSGNLTRMVYFQELLRLIYRLLFLFTAEDRNLLFNPDTADSTKRLYKEGYSLSLLRERALKRRFYDHYEDLWCGLRVLFKSLGHGEEALGLPALNGLFGSYQCPTLESAEINNTYILHAIRALCFFQSDHTLSRINYRDMGTEELGSVYESLLELHPYIDVETWKFAFVGEDQESANSTGSERKRTASYYTAPSLVHELIKSTLEPVITQTLKEHPQNPKQALLNLNIIDPACGSGHFLLAAARRLAAEIARLEAGPNTPEESLRQHALREVVRHCIYGVDRNPLSVELCKTALWIETVEPGKPLSFLDGHIRCGDSLVGIFKPEEMNQGIPEDAYKKLTGDDSQVCTQLKRSNRAARQNIQNNLFNLHYLKSVFDQVELLPEDDLIQLEYKKAAFGKAQQDHQLELERFKANLFVAAFFAAKTEEFEQLIPTNNDLLLINQSLISTGMQDFINKLAKDFRFFHWYLEFPEIFAQGGFDVVLGNPPWERIKLQEHEFFASRNPNIARAADSAEREKYIKELSEPGANPAQRLLFEEFNMAKREAEASSLFTHTQSRYTLTGVGDVNTYALFAETILHLLSPTGRAGFIVPTGIATDDNTKKYFEFILENQRLFSLFDFENREKIFPAVDSREKFCLLSLAPNTDLVSFIFFAKRIEHLNDELKCFTITSDDIKLINPNTKTCPIFRSSYDVELTKKIYKNYGAAVLEVEEGSINPWGLNIKRIFDMNKRSVLSLCSKEPLPAYLPIYESKLCHQFDNRWATYNILGDKVIDIEESNKSDFAFEPRAQYWISENIILEKVTQYRWNYNWLIGWRDITNATNERTSIAFVIPRVGTDFTIRLGFFESSPQLIACFLGNVNSLVLDYICRQKLGGKHLSDYIFKQLPIIPPEKYDAFDLRFIIPRVLELSYTSYSLNAFALDLGYNGPPFTWDLEQRSKIRAELDAYYANLYGLTKDELRYILAPSDIFGEDFPSETFRVLRTNEIRQYGEYRTQRLVLEAWERFTIDGTFSKEGQSELSPA